MDGPHGVPSFSPHAEASANINPMDASTSLGIGEPRRPEEIQVPRSPQPLSLQINGHNAETLHNQHSTGSYVESSERGSDTSVDSRRPEPQSASTFTDSLPSIPSSSLNDPSQSLELGNTRADGNSQESRPNHKPPNSQETSQITSINEHGAIDGPHDPVVPGNGHNGSISPSRSPKSSTTRSEHGMQFAPGHKRTATGDVKSVPESLAVPRVSDTNGAARRRSKSTGSPAHGSKIAQLSVHIRTRLSYAAAKIEKSRQSRENSSQLPLRGLETLASLSSESPSDATPISGPSIPGSNPTSHPQHQTKRPTNDTARSYPQNHRAQSAISSPGQMFPIPKLAPPVDIISSNGETGRRRPNPDLAARSPYARHKRHHSYQEHSLARPLNGSSSVVGHGAPSIPPSSQNGSFYRPGTQSQNTSMEQDAIETLLFMSSPENSGYRSSPRHVQPAATQQSLNESIYSKNSDVSTNPSQQSQSDASYNGRVPAQENYGLGLEARAGDEIDRLLDQMESDSEDDSLFASRRHRMNGQTLRGHPGQPR